MGRTAPSILLLLVFLLVALPEASSRGFFRSNDDQDDNDLVGEGQGIVGGSKAEDSEFPWFAAFVPLVQCGGTLIAPDRVLTAAHCIQRGAPTNVRIGPTTLSNGENIAVTCGMYHPDYRVGASGDLFNDVAVLKLSTSSSATPIKLNSNLNYPSTSGSPLQVVGFGATKEGGSTSNVLKKLGTYFQTIESCQGNYGNVEFGTHVCGNVDNEGDCQGDSGGPLFDATETQIGIVSYGIGCARPSEDVYAGVAKYHDWIQEQINNDECNVQASCGFLASFFGCLDRARDFVLGSIF
ncbi:Plasminogen (Fragment) [Seminavis robusta]|uniref:Plasminogen n=1 Tax=Seminavis robusta TaxID=568900 RepID=A0A9N8DPW4_9STRA